MCTYINLTWLKFRFSFARVYERFSKTALSELTSYLYGVKSSVHPQHVIPIEPSWFFGHIETFKSMEVGDSWQKYMTKWWEGCTCVYICVWGRGVGGLGVGKGQKKRVWKQKGILGTEKPVQESQIQGEKWGIYSIYAFEVGLLFKVLVVFGK